MGDINKTDNSKNSSGDKAGSESEPKLAINTSLDTTSGKIYTRSIDSDESSGPPYSRPSALATHIWNTQLTPQLASSTEPSSAATPGDVEPSGPFGPATREAFEKAIPNSNPSFLEKKLMQLDYHNGHQVTSTSPGAYVPPHRLGLPMPSTNDAASPSLAFIEGAPYHAVPKLKPEPEPAFQPNQQPQSFRKPFIHLPAEHSIFVGQLGHEVDESLLWKTFGPRYQSFIKANLMRDRDTGFSRGFAFVRFTDPSERDHALVHMDGFYVGNSRMVVGRANKELHKGPGQQQQLVASQAPMAASGFFSTGIPVGGMMGLSVRGGGGNSNSYIEASPGSDFSNGQGDYKQISQWIQAPRQMPLPHSLPENHSVIGGYRGGETTALAVRPPYPPPVGTSPWLSNRPGFGFPPRSRWNSFGPKPFVAATPGSRTTVDPNNVTVFVGGLPYGTSVEQLRQRFEQAGEIVHINIPTGKGCGFVKFASHDEALAVIEHLQGLELNNARLRLSWGKHGKPYS